MGDLPHRVPHDPRYFTADVHITPDGRARIGPHTYSPEEYGDLLRRSGWDGRTPIRVIGCDAGSNDFADRLARHTGADVLAPTKPAWTDSNGRVYTSDAEIGPDGNRQPRIPPNGEWNTHRPDGTTTRTGDDGFAPGTPDTAKHDLDPTDAKDRGKKGDDPLDKPGDKTGKSPRDKIKDIGYLKDNYQLRQRENGRWELMVKPNQTDADGLKPKPVDVTPADWQPPADRDVSKIDLGEVEVKFKDERAPAEPADYHSTQVDQRGKVDPEVADSFKQLLEDRRQAIQDSLDRAGTPEYAEANTRATKLGEEVGERAALNYADEFHPGATRVDAELRGGGRFDVVMHDDGRHTVIEAKGASISGVGDAEALDGTRVEQGHDKYYDKKIDDMLNAKLSGRAERDMRAKLADEGLTPEQVDQRVADHKAKLDSDRELAKELARARDPQVLADYLRDRSGVSENEIDDYLRREHGDAVGNLDGDDFQNFKREQGYQEFFQNKVDELRASDSPADRELADKLDHVRRHGMVEYVLVSAKLKVENGQEVYDGYLAKQFLMGWQRDV